MTMSRLKFSALLSLALGLGSAGQAATVNGMVAANTAITNQAFMEGTQGDSGLTYTEQSNVVTVTVTAVGGVNVSIGGKDISSPGVPGDTVYTNAGDTGSLPFVLTNTGNGPDTFTITLSQNSGAPLTSLEYWVDTNGDNVQDSGEIFPSGSTVTLAAGSQQTVYVLGTLPINSLGADTYVVQLTAQSSVDPSPSDSDNYGLYDTQDILGARLDNDHFNQPIRPGQVLTLNKLFQNSGNIPADLTNVSFEVTEDDLKNILTFSYQFGTAAADASLQTAWENYFNSFGALAPGANIPLKVTATAVSSSTSMLTSDVYTLEAETKLTPAANSTAQADDFNISSYKPALYSATPTKTQALCADVSGTYVCSSLDTTDRSPIPCDVMVYRVSVISGSSTGSALRRPVMRDGISDLLTPLYARSYISPSLDAMNNNTYYAGLVSTDNAAWSAQVNSFTGPTVIYAGYDSNTDGTMTTDDFMTSGNVLELEIAAQVKGNNCTPFVKANAVNYPNFPIRAGIISVN